MNILQNPSKGFGKECCSWEAGKTSSLGSLETTSWMTMLNLCLFIFYPLWNREVLMAFLLPVRRSHNHSHHCLHVYDIVLSYTHFWHLCWVECKTLWNNCMLIQHWNRNIAYIHKGKIRQQFPSVEQLTEKKAIKCLLQINHQFISFIFCFLCVHK